MGLKEAYHEQLDAQLREWSAKLDQLKAKADGAEAAAKVEYYKQIESIKTKADVAQAKLRELNESSGEHGSRSRAEWSAHGLTSKLRLRRLPESLSKSRAFARQSNTGIKPSDA